MLDICVDSAKVAVENLKRVFASPFGIFMYAALSGMIGIVILLAFFSMLLSGSALIMILPGIVAFNAASGGYGLVDKGGREFPRLRVSLIGLSILLSVTACFALTVFTPWERMTDGVWYLVSGLSALVFSFFGAWVATKKINLERTS